MTFTVGISCDTVVDEYGSTCGAREHLAILTTTAAAREAATARGWALGGAVGGGDLCPRHSGRLHLRPVLRDNVRPIRLSDPARDRTGDVIDLATRRPTEPGASS